jgi:hypothetical protein
MNVREGASINSDKFYKQPYGARIAEQEANLERIAKVKPILDLNKPILFI